MGKKTTHTTPDSDIRCQRSKSYAQAMRRLPQNSISRSGVESIISFPMIWTGAIGCFGGGVTCISRDQGANASSPMSMPDEIMTSFSFFPILLLAGLEMNGEAEVRFWRMEGKCLKKDIEGGARLYSARMSLGERSWFEVSREMFQGPSWYGSQSPTDACGPVGDLGECHVNASKQCLCLC